MKRIIYTAMALLTLSVVTLSSCDKIKNLAKVNLNLDNGDGEFNIPALTAVGEVSLGTDDVYINLDSLIKNENNEASALNIREVHVKSVQLTLTNGDAKNNFSALESCKMDIKSNVKSDFVTMASITNNPDVEAYTLDLPVESSLELKDYFLNANTFSYRISGKTRKTTDKELNCKVLVKYTLVIGG